MPAYIASSSVLNVPTRNVTANTRASLFVLASASFILCGFISVRLV